MRPTTFHPPQSRHTKYQNTSTTPRPRHSRPIQTILRSIYMGDEQLSRYRPNNTYNVVFTKAAMRGGHFVLIVPERYKRYTRSVP